MESRTPKSDTISKFRLFGSCLHIGYLLRLRGTHADVSVAYWILPVSVIKDKLVPLHDM